MVQVSYSRRILPLEMKFGLMGFRTMCGIISPSWAAHKGKLHVARGRQGGRSVDGHPTISDSRW